MRWLIFLLVFTISNNTFCQSAENHTLVFGHGTAIIVLVTPDTLWIAADTKLLEEGESNNFTSKIDHKIHEANGIFFAISGLSYFTYDDDTIFKTDVLIRDVIQNEKKFIPSVTAVQDSLLSQLENVARLLRVENYPVFQLHTDEPIIELTMVTFMNDIPVSFFGKYGYHATDSATVETFAMNTIIHFKDTLMYYLGNASSLKPFIEQNEKFLLSSRRTKEKLACLINMQARNTPLQVAMPADVLKLTKDTSVLYMNLYEQDCELFELH